MPLSKSQLNLSHQIRVAVWQMGAGLLFAGISCFSYPALAIDIKATDIKATDIKAMNADSIDYAVAASEESDLLATSLELADDDIPEYDGLDDFEDMNDAESLQNNSGYPTNFDEFDEGESDANKNVDTSNDKNSSADSVIAPITKSESDNPVDLAVATKTGQGDEEVSLATILPKQQMGFKKPDIALNSISPTTLKTFVEVIDLVRREYVEPVSDETLFNDAMSGMLSRLDSHAEFLDAEAYENLREFTQGDVGDVGLRAQYQSLEGHWVITEVEPASPAADERIQVGDYLHQIDEVKLTDSKNINDVEQMLSGIAGTQVQLVVSSKGRRKRTLTLQRNQAKEQKIQVRLQEGVAIVKLPVFQNNSKQKLLDKLIQLNAPISGIVFDVRDNPGGVLDSAVDIASLFVKNAPVVQIQGREGIEQTLYTNGTAILADVPVIVLQNRYSASAAEVLASSLKTQNRAQIVGETSYGKGSVQSIIPVNDQQAIKLTVAHYLTADGKEIDGIGVTPNIPLMSDEVLWEQQAVTLMLAKAKPAGVRLQKAAE